MQTMRALFFAVAAVVSNSAVALDYPKGSAFDDRIRTTVYNRADVVQLDAVIGIQTHIEVEPGEKYVTHAFGDAGGYTFGAKDNHFFIKAISEQANTNLTIVTDRRVYNFRLIFVETRNAPATYDLSFIYPDTQERLAREALAKADLEQAFNAKRGKANTQYEMAGDLEIAPVNTWDDQEFTYFKFPANADLPGIYYVDSKGNESIVDRVSVGAANDIYAVPKVSAKWMLRLGEDAALAVYNTAYDAVGVTNTTGTNSPMVKRVVKGAKQ